MYTAQATIPNLLRQTIIEKNTKKNVCVYNWVILLYTEMNTTLQINYTAIKNKCIAFVSGFFHLA